MVVAPPTTQGPSVEPPATERVVTCTVDRETYAFPVLAVREVVRWMPVTRIPRGAAAVKGVINLRGEIVPLIDLRLLLGLPATEPTDRTCIVVVALPGNGSKLQAGLIVDAALEVARVPIRAGTDGTEALPGRSGRYVSGIAQGKGGLLILLDCQRLIADTLAAPEGA